MQKILHVRKQYSTKFVLREHVYNSQKETEVVEVGAELVGGGVDDPMY